MSISESTATQPVDGSARGFWSSVREALRGTHQDYTSGSLNRSIFLLAIPMVLEMVLESLFAVSGRLLGRPPRRKCRRNGRAD